MSKHFFDYDDGDFAYTVSDNMAIDSEPKSSRDG